MFGVTGILPVAVMVFVELFGSFGTFEFMALAGNARQRNGHKKQGKKFHHRAS